MRKFIQIKSYDHLNFIKQDFNDFEILYLNNDNIKEIYNQINSISLFKQDNKYLIIDQEELFAGILTNDLKIFIDALDNNKVMVVKNISEEILDYIKDFSIEEKQFDKVDIINQTIEKLNINIEEEALNLLIFNLDENETLIINELNKLSILTNNITVDVVNQCSYKTQSAQAFDLVKLVVNKQNSLANKLGKQLLEQDFDEIGLLTFLQKQISTYYLVKILLYKYKKLSIESLLNITSFRLDMIIENIKHIDKDSLANLIIKLNQEEHRIKKNH